MDQKEDISFQTKDYKAMLRTRHQSAQMGFRAMEPWPADNAARLMSIVQVWGNNEGFTLSGKFQIDREYIQELYGLSGGEIPERSFSTALRKWVQRYEDVKSENSLYFKEAHDWIMKMYGFKLIF